VVGWAINNSRGVYMGRRKKTSSLWGNLQFSDHQKKVRIYAFVVALLLILVMTGLIYLIYWLNTPGFRLW